MKSSKLNDTGTVDALVELSYSDPGDSTSPLNDEVFRIFLDYHWETNQRFFISVTMTNVIYGFVLTGVSRSVDNFDNFYVLMV
jgi:hypothetical protein